MKTDEGILYIVSTPIGNLGDMTPRALNALRECDCVYAEDTRVTGKLLSAFDIKKPILRLDENVIRQKTSEVIDRVVAGDVVCYCTDAGMPAVSDPGSHLIGAAHAARIRCEILPGASAAALAYVSSGFACSSYYFGGFFPRKTSERESLLTSLASLDAALVFYESPHRLLDALSCIAKLLPQRMVCVCRELTKLHEEVVCASAADLIELFGERQKQGGIKGEIAIVIDAPSEEESSLSEQDDLEAAKAMIAELVASGERVKTAASKAAATCNIAKNVAYDLALAAKKDIVDG